MSDDLLREALEALNDLLAVVVNEVPMSNWTQEDYDAWDATRTKIEKVLGTTT